MWHMHQPLYKSAATGDYILPWVRLHATKGYLDIASKMLEFPEVGQTINIVPSLVFQIRDYLSSDVTDRFKAVTAMPAEELSPDERKFILKYFFSINWDNCIRPIPRYWSLLRKRGMSIDHTEIDIVLGRFSTDDFRDLQVLFNLAWLGFTARKEPLVQDLIEKGHGFTDEEKASLLRYQDECLARLIDLWSKLGADTAAEISTSPFYHPILPLVSNSNNADKQVPGEVLRKINFNYPEDASAQVRRAISFMSSLLGIRPQGMWPSEGSVSNDIIEIFHKEGLRWIATDKEILMQSKVADCGQPVVHTEPYRIPVGDGEVAIFFRDTHLSDAIGFEYHKRCGADAAEEFLASIKKLAEANATDRSPIVSVILDGENPWEYYSDGGEAFLTALFDDLSRSKSGVRPTTFSGYLDNHGAGRTIESLYAGSWIRHNFLIWIGDGEKDRAWKFLSQARKIIKEYFERNPEASADLKAEVFEHIYAAEGSDWFWWYGEPFHTKFDSVFDLLFRQHLIKVYELLGKGVPGELKQPNTSEARFIADREPVDVVSPIIDGKITSYFEWVASGMYLPKISGTVMARDREPLFKAVYWGFDGKNLFIRLDLSEKSTIGSGLTLVIRFYHPGHIFISLPLDESCEGYCFNKPASEQLSEYRRMKPAAVADIAEIGIPFEDLGAEGGDHVSFAVYLAKGADYIERCPFDGTINFTAPGTDYRTQMWKV